jgi:2-dehydropantoate 2-reductase
LSQRGYRRCLALAQAETIRLLAAAGIKPARLTPLPPKLMPRLLGVPDALFARLARRMLAIDPHARTSMLDDLEAGRLTEIGYINGEVVRLADSLGRSAPVNAKLVALVHQAESGGRRQWSADDLYAELRNA